MSRVSPSLLAALDPLLDQALELSPAELTSWLDRLERDDPAMAGELRALLDEETRLDARDFLRTGAPADLFAADDIAQPPQRIGPYTLDHPLGRGGMGSVWLARRDDGRYVGQVAIKLLNLALLGRVGSERFHREGTALARLTHPNIAHLIDAGVTQGGHPYLVLEFVQGQRIDHYCNERRLDPQARIALFLQVLAAVAHAHAHLIVHRDLKPSNILVTADGEVKLLDFGIAKLLETETEAAERSELTDLGGLAMTPGYAAPEQALGGPVSTATDVYALGVLLFLLLAGRHPTGEGLRTAAEHLRGVLDVEPAPLSATVSEAAAAERSTSLDRLRRMYRGDLDNILAKALKKDATQRYTTAVAFGDDLQRYLGHQPVQARRDSLGYRARKFLRRNRAAVAAAVLVFLTLSTAAFVTTRQMVEAREQRDEALFQARRAQAQQEFQTLLLSSAGEKPLTPREILDRGRTLMQQEWIGEPRFSSSILLNLADLYHQMGDDLTGAQLLGEADSLARRARAADMLVPVLCAQALNVHSRDSTTRALALLDSARLWFPRADRSDVARCLSVEATIAHQTGRADSAVALGQRAVALMTSMGDTTGTRYLDALNILANALENAGRGREAISTYENIGAVLTRSGRRHAMVYNVILNNIGIALSNLGEMNRADSILRQTVAEFQQSDRTGFVHPAILMNYNRTLLFLRQLDSAAFWYQRMVSQAEARKDIEMQQSGHYGLTRVEVLRGRLADAERHARMTQRFGGMLERPKSTDDLVLAGLLATARGDPATGLTRLEAALQQEGYAEGKRPYSMRVELVLAAEAALALGNSTKAIEYARAARRMTDVDSLTSTRSAYVGEAALLEARGLLLAGDSSGARNLLHQAHGALSFGAGAQHLRTRQARSLLDSLGLAVADR